MAGPFPVGTSRCLASSANHGDRAGRITSAGLANSVSLLPLSAGARQSSWPWFSEAARSQFQKMALLSTAATLLLIAGQMITDVIKSVLAKPARGYRRCGSLLRLRSRILQGFFFNFEIAGIDDVSAGQDGVIPGQKFDDPLLLVFAHHDGRQIKDILRKEGEGAL